MQLACSTHFRINALSSLAAVPATDLPKAYDQLTEPLRQHALNELHLPTKRTKAEVRKAVARLALGMATWKLALLWIHAAGQAVGFVGCELLFHLGFQLESLGSLRLRALRFGLAHS